MIRRPWLCLGCVLVVLILTISGSATGQGSPQTVSGRVMYENRQPASQVPVQLRNFTDMGMSQTTTDLSGNFSFRNVSPGVYYVTVNLPGYIEANQRVEVGVFSSGLIFLYLKRLPDDKTVSTTPPVSGVSSEYLKIPLKAREEYELGMRLYQKDNQLEKGLEHLQRAITLHPGFAQAYYGMGLLLIDLNRFDEAREALSNALKENESLLPVYFPLGALYNQKREYAEAEKVLRKGLQIKEDIWQIHFELARSVAYQGRWNEAETIARRAAELNDKAEKVQLLLANIYFELGKDEEALAAAERFLKLAPNDPIAPQIQARVTQMRSNKPPL